jgi:multidrug resistance efflux pump
MTDESKRKSLSVVKDDSAARQPSVPRAPEAIHALETAAPDRRPRLRLSIVAAFVALTSVSVVAWGAYRLQNVVARNALVRGDIVEVGARFSGTLASTEVLPGEKVRAGQVIAHLEDRHLRAQEAEVLAQIEALENQIVLERSSIEQDRASLRVRIDEADAKAAASLAEVAAARVRAREARDYRLARSELAQQGMISGEALRDAQNRVQLADESLSVANAQARAAQFSLQSARVDLRGVGVREKQLDVLRSQVSAARSRLERVRADIESSLIRAPSDASVLYWMVKPGGSLREGMPVAVLSVGQTMWVQAWIDEDDIGRVSVGSPATVTLASQQSTELSGVVQRIGVATDYEHPVAAVPEPRASRMRTAPLIPVDIRLEGRMPALIPGLSAAVAIRSDRFFLPFGQVITQSSTAR